MSSYVVKEREWDTESVRSGRQPQHYTTVRRYKVPDRTTDRTVIDFNEDNRGDEELRIVRRERDDRSSFDRSDRGDRDVVSYRIVEREREREPEVRREKREIKIVREDDRSPSPERERERGYRFERDVDRLSSHSRPYDLERYSKSTEYFSRPEPQPIIIRESVPQPIIIQEQPREVIVRRERSPSSSPSPPPPVERAESVVSRSVVDRSVERSVVDDRTALIPAPQAPPPQEDYYYERVTREVDRPRRRHRDDDRRERRDKEKESYSDDDVLYVRRETEDIRDESPHTKRHLAEGAIAGLGAAALVRHHKKKQGEPQGHRGRQALGYAVAGAVGAEALSRGRRAWDDRQRSRSFSEDDYDDRDGGRSRSRRRRKSSSHKNRNTALAVAGIAAAAAAAYAAGKRNNNNNTTVIEQAPRRSRSRRRHSVSGASDRSITPEGERGENATSPGHRNRRIAQAGLAGAALAGLAEHHRSKSRGGKSRSKSRVREGVPIVAAGLGSAAVAGLYENFKARKERKRSQSQAREAGREQSRSPSRTRERSRSVGHRDARAAGEAGLIEYGTDPLYTHDDHRDRRRSRSRGRSRSSSGSDRHRHHGRSRSRSHSRGAQLATAAAAAGVTGLAVNEARKRRERKKEEKERRRREEEAVQPRDDYYDPLQYYPQTNQFPPPPPTTSPYAQGPYEPPQAVQGAPPNQAYDPAYHPYNPAEYGQQTGPTMPAPEQYYRGGVQSPAQEYYQQPHPGGAPPAHGGAYPENPENVSAADFAAPAPYASATEHSREVSDGLNQPIPQAWTQKAGPELHVQQPTPAPTDVPNPIDIQRAQSASPAIPSGMSTPKSVKFNLPDKDEEAPRRHSLSDDEQHNSSRNHRSDRHHHSSSSSSSHHHHYDDSSPEAESSRHVAQRDRHNRRRSRSLDDYGSSRSAQHNRRRRDGSPDSQDSGDTIELPQRFDEHGRNRAGEDADPLAAKIEDFLSGRNQAGRMFQGVVQDFLAPGGSGSDSGGGRRRRRRR